MKDDNPYIDENTSLPIVVTVEGSSIDELCPHRKAHLPMTVTPVGIITDGIGQALNANASIVLTVDGIMNDDECFIGNAINVVLAELYNTPSTAT